MFVWGSYVFFKQPLLDRKVDSDEAKVIVLQLEPATTALRTKAFIRGRCFTTAPPQHTQWVSDVLGFISWNSALVLLQMLQEKQFCLFGPQNIFLFLKQCAFFFLVWKATKIYFLIVNKQMWKSSANLRKFWVILFWSNTSFLRIPPGKESPTRAFIMVSRAGPLHLAVFVLGGFGQLSAGRLHPDHLLVDGRLRVCLDILAGFTLKYHRDETGKKNKISELSKRRKYESSISCVKIKVCHSSAQTASVAVSPETPLNPTAKGGKQTLFLCFLSNPKNQQIFRN